MLLGAKETLMIMVHYVKVIPFKIVIPERQLIFLICVY